MLLYHFPSPDQHGTHGFWMIEVPISTIDKSNKRRRPYQRGTFVELPGSDPQIAYTSATPAAGNRIPEQLVLYRSRIGAKPTQRNPHLQRSWQGMFSASSKPRVLNQSWKNLRHVRGHADSHRAAGEFERSIAVG
jgi:hypothetical protein